MDILSDVLSLLRTHGHVYGRIELSGPFGFAFPHHYGICLAVMEGSCFLNIEKGDLLELSVGDFVFLPTSETFYLRSDRHVHADLLMSAEQMAQWPSTKRLTHDGGEGQTVSLISGCFTFSSPENYLLIGQFPKLMHIKAQDTGPSTQHLMRLMKEEIDQEEPGSSTVIDRLAEVLLMQAIRHNINQADGCSQGWLKALGDRKICSALKLMHSNLKASWTVEQVARDVGMSRSAFAARFKEVVGKTPLDHLTEWRMAHAAGLIRNNPEMKIDAIAEAIGYQSESSFRKAFHKVMNRSPRAYRDASVMTTYQ